MNIILISDFCQKRGSMEVCVSKLVIWFLLGITALSGALFWAGYQIGTHKTEKKQNNLAYAELHEILRQSSNQVAEAQSEQRAHLDALALRLASLNVRIMRIDALGERLVGVGKLDKGEFDFSIAPPVGGVAFETGESQDISEITVDMQRISGLLEDREAKLEMLEAQLMNRELIRETLPSGRPVEKGWFSSNYGVRTDPFTGRKSFHKGVDFAGKRGSEVYSVAAGIVERSVQATGFGNLVEIRHADGYSTLYAHNQKNLVKKGDVVAKGQTIALLGSTGRSSGPHVHFEVHRNNQPVDPKKYIRSP